MRQIPIKDNCVDYNIRRSISEYIWLVVICERAILCRIAAVAVRLADRHNRQDCFPQCLIDRHAQPSNVSSLAMISM